MLLSGRKVLIVSAMVPDRTLLPPPVIFEVVFSLSELALVYSHHPTVPFHFHL